MPQQKFDYSEPSSFKSEVADLDFLNCSYVINSTGQYPMLLTLCK